MSEAQERQEAHLDTAGLPSPGQMLKRERERLGMNLDEVAVQLNLRPAVVTGLEVDSYDQVPVAAYRRGYLRAYARLVGIDEVKVVNAYDAQHGRSDLERKLTPMHTTKPPSRVGAWVFKLVTLLVILGLIGLTLLWWQSRQSNDLLGLSGSDEPVAEQSLNGDPTAETDDTVAGSDEASPALPPVPEEDSELGLVDDESPGTAPATQPQSDAMADNGQAGMIEPGSEPTTASDDTVASAEPADGAQPTDADQAAGEADVAPDETAEPETQATAPPVDERSMSISFGEESWTEIFDANDNRVLVGLQPAGSEVTIEGEPPFRLTIGNASGVELSYRGEPIDLGTHASDNDVARFNLGE